MKFIINILKGVIIGLANIIPGVSGGTMMVSMGIYDDIISSVTNLFKQFKKSIVMLLPYGIGMAIGIVGLSFLITHFMEKTPFQTSMLFIGLILGGLPMIWGKVKKGGFGVGKLVVFVLFFSFIIALQVFSGHTNGSDVKLTVSLTGVIILFLVGILAAATMVIPGVSGSMILMILGYYNPVLATIKDFAKAVTKFKVERILHDMAILVPFGLGVVIGIFLVAKLIELLLKKAEAVTYSGILGLVVAAPVVIIMLNGLPKTMSVSLMLSSAGVFCLGFIGAYLLGKE